jgi:Ankyrin repeats (many copies)
MKGTTIDEASQATESVAGDQPTANSNMRVAEWVGTLESLRREQRLSDVSGMVPTTSSIFSVDEAHTVVTNPTVVTSSNSPQRALLERDVVDAELNDSEDDLETDLAKAALGTGANAFEGQEWDEADSLLQEALRLLQQLPNKQRAFCDVFALQYKLAVCAYHIREPTVAEEALMSLVQQSASSDEQRGYICDAAHLLSHLYLRMGQVDRARSQCEKALQARRRLLGKQSDASLESTALMAHIYFLLNNGARAKSYLAMIPEARRETVLKTVQMSLGTKVEPEHSDPSPLPIAEDSGLTTKKPKHSDSSPLQTWSIHENSSPVAKRIPSRHSNSSPLRTESIPKNSDLAATHTKNPDSSPLRTWSIHENSGPAAKRIPSRHSNSSPLRTESIPKNSDLAAMRIQSTHSEPPPLPHRPMLEKSHLATKRTQGRPSAPSPAMHMESRFSRPISTIISQSPAGSFRRFPEPSPTVQVGLEDRGSVVVTSPPPAEEKSGSRTGERDRSLENEKALEKARSKEQVRAKEQARAVDQRYSGHPAPLSTAATSPGEPPVANERLEFKTLSRKEILENIGCQPSDRIEKAVCDGDHPAVTTLLSKKKHFWSSRFRKRGRSERVTALHFAALFGEIDMARRLLSSNFNINEVPFGYTTCLTPLKFAIGARQVEMVDFLIANGARPSEPDSWSTLAGQLMNRSWLKKTMSEADKEDVPSRIIGILGILLAHGWNVNVPFESSGRTVLQQAVTFWTGDYSWDLNLRAAVTSFLCERGADPFQANTERKTPYTMALASGHQDLLRILDRPSRKLGPEPIELPTS